MATLTQLADYVTDELGTELAAFYSNWNSLADIYRYIEEGQHRLGYLIERSSTLTWSAADTEVSLPADCELIGEILPDIGINMPAYRVWGNELIFTDPLGSSQDGTARILYLGTPTILDSGSDVSDLPAEGNTAIVAFALYRCFGRIANSRAEYKRYSTIMQANGVEIQDLHATSDKYYREYQEAKDSLPLRASTSFFND